MSSVCGKEKHSYRNIMVSVLSYFVSLLYSCFLNAYKLAKQLENSWLSH